MLIFGLLLNISKNFCAHFEYEKEFNTECPDDKGHVKKMGNQFEPSIKTNPVPETSYELNDERTNASEQHQDLKNDQNNITSTRNDCRPFFGVTNCYKYSNHFFDTSERPYFMLPTVTNGNLFRMENVRPHEVNRNPPKWYKVCPNDALPNGHDEPYCSLKLVEIPNKALVIPHGTNEDQVLGESSQSQPSSLNNQADESKNESDERLINQ